MQSIAKQQVLAEASWAGAHAAGNAGIPTEPRPVSAFAGQTAINSFQTQLRKGRVVAAAWGSTMLMPAACMSYDSSDSYEF